MKKICAWCDTEILSSTKKPVADPVITHGICRTCARKLFKQLSKPLQEFLDQLTVPILLIESEPKVMTANKMAQNLLGKDLSQIQGRKGGEVINCAYARNPEGCGNSVHCASCTIRQTVLQTFTTGESFIEVPAYPDIQKFDEVKTFCVKISTEKVGEYVLLRIDQMQEHKD